MRVLENLKNPYVQECISSGLWHVKDLHTLDKDILNPEKWQLLHEERMPKSIIGERKKGMIKCPRCKSFYTKLDAQVQTRSADEGMTSKFHCLDCEYIFKIN